MHLAVLLGWPCSMVMAVAVAVAMTVAMALAFLLIDPCGVMMLLMSTCCLMVTVRMLPAACSLMMIPGASTCQLQAMLLMVFSTMTQIFMMKWLGMQTMAGWMRTRRCCMM